MKDLNKDGSISRRRLLGNSVLAGSLAASPLSLWAQADKAMGEVTQSARLSITVGIVQQAREPELDANRDKITRFIEQAKARKCRLVIFPEDALGSPVGTSNEDLEKVVDGVREAAHSNDVYVVFCSSLVIPGFAPDRRGHCLRVVGPDGRILLRFNKLICNLPRWDPRRAPGIFRVDGIPCCAMICADRWLRGFEELPVTLGGTRSENWQRCAGRNCS